MATSGNTGTTTIGNFEIISFSTATATIALCPNYKNISLLRNVVVIITIANNIGLRIIRLFLSILLLLLLLLKLIANSPTTATATIIIIAKNTISKVVLLLELMLVPLTVRIRPNMSQKHN